MARRRPTPPDVPAVTLVRTIHASTAEVFAAWTEARLLSRWLAAHDCVVREASADPRPGGAYRIAVVCPPAGDVHVTTGEYRELVPHARIVMTWRYDGPHGADDAPSLLTVELRERGPGTTELTLTHARARDLRARELLAVGWPTCLDKLAALLAASSHRPDGDPDGDSETRALYRALLDAWNARDAAAYAALIAPSGTVIGFDGSQMTGRAEVEGALAAIFAHHPTAAYVSIVRGVRRLGSGVVLLRAVAGMAPPGQTELNPAVNAVQTLVAVRHDGTWQVELFQNTPAAFHGRPDASAALTAELRAALQGRRSQ